MSTGNTDKDPIDDVLEEVLREGKFKHISDQRLVGLRNDTLDEIEFALVNSHLELCLICEYRVQFFKETEEALEAYEVTESDREVIKRVLGRINERTLDWLKAKDAKGKVEEP